MKWHSGGSERLGARWHSSAPACAQSEGVATRTPSFGKETRAKSRQKEGAAAQGRALDRVMVITLTWRVVSIGSSPSSCSQGANGNKSQLAFASAWHWVASQWAPSGCTRTPSKAEHSTRPGPCTMRLPQRGAERARQPLLS